MIDTHTKLSKRKAPPAGQIVKGLINIALISLAVRDIRKRRADEIKGNRKVWLAAACLPPFGPIAYLVFGRKRNTSTTEIALESTE
jgi:hypothetical protein